MGNIQEEHQKEVMHLEILLTIVPCHPSESQFILLTKATKIADSQMTFNSIMGLEAIIKEDFLQTLIKIQISKLMLRNINSS